LAAANTGLARTIMKSRRGLLKAFKEAKTGDFISLIPLLERRLKKGQQVFCQKKNVLALWWRDKRELWMLGTRHTAHYFLTRMTHANQLLTKASISSSIALCYILNAESTFLRYLVFL
jgi:hypothetical protein